MPAAPRCLACGACCFSLRANYVRVSGKDHARLAHRADALVRFDGNRAYMRMIDGHCAALILLDPPGGFVCGAYETRPQICRDLARGSSACEAERHEKHRRPLLILEARAGRRPPFAPASRTSSPPGDAR